MITIFLPDSYVDKLNELVIEGVYPSRNEAIRLFIFDGLKVLAREEDARIDRGRAAPNREVDDIEG